MMNSEVSEEFFQKVLDKRLSSIKEVLSVKAKEYVRNSDRLHNFNRAAEMRRISREAAIQGMADKHWVSVLDMVDDLNYTPSVITDEYVEEKIGDAINYLILLEVSIKHRNADFLG